MKMVQSGDHHIRKGPWTGQEDRQLIYYVGLFGGRRWDFVAKVSGLRRTGKSCRLRWVNYLQPGLKRGRLTSQEERLILELHSRWGNRWSKIARKLPGRTDNEIKNYWRIHERNMVQEMKRPANLLSFTSMSTVTTANESSLKSQMIIEGNSNLNSKGTCFADLLAIKGDVKNQEEDYPIDQIWKEIASSQEQDSTEQAFYKDFKEDACSYSCPLMASPFWEFGFDSLWTKDEEEINMLAPTEPFAPMSTWGSHI